MDPQRRTLYVEGEHDQWFLEWLVKPDRDPNAQMWVADFVDVPNVKGGARERLLAFARQIDGSNAAIRIFVDADWGYLTGEVLPPGVWRTDARDMEGYLLREECFDKAVALVLKVNTPTGRDLLADVLQHARILGLVRLTSSRQGYQLPFSGVDLTRYVDVTDRRLGLDRNRYVTTLVGKAPWVTRQAFDEAVAAEDAACRDVADAQLAHGKEVLLLVDEVAAACGYRRQQRRDDGGDGRSFLWGTFERGDVQQYASLREVCAYLRRH